MQVWRRWRCGKEEEEEREREKVGSVGRLWGETVVTRCGECGCSCGRREEGERRGKRRQGWTGMGKADGRWKQRQRQRQGKEQPPGMVVLTRKTNFDLDSGVQRKELMMATRTMGQLSA